MNKVILLVVLSCLFVAGQVFSQIPSELYYESFWHETGAVDVVIRIYTNATAGDCLCEDSNTVTVSNGWFSTRIGDNPTPGYGPLSDALASGIAYLDVTINGTTLPREQILPEAFALKAAAVPDSAITASMIADNAIETRHIVNGAVGANQLDADAVTSDAIADGTIDDSDLGPSVENRFVKKSGDTATNLAVSGYLTADNVSALNFTNPTNTVVGTSSICIGGELNVITGSCAAIVGGRCNVVLAEKAFIGAGMGNVAGSYAVVGGGGNNLATNNSAVVGGGSGNSAAGIAATVAGGSAGVAAGAYSSVGGGQQNTASGTHCVVAGGTKGLAESYAGAVVGGYQNKAGQYCFVGGGMRNVASTGSYASVPGGYYNRAIGDYSLAAGYKAYASNVGAFVWSDSSDGNYFYSQGDYSFNVRARGGAVFDGNVAATGTITAASVQMTAIRVTGTSGSFIECQGDISMGTFTNAP